MGHKQTFPETMRRLRFELGLTQEQLARVTGISLRTVARYEAGWCPRKLTAMEKLFRFMQQQHEAAKLRVLAESDEIEKRVSDAAKRQKFT